MPFEGQRRNIPGKGWHYWDGSGWIPEENQTPAPNMTPVPAPTPTPPPSLSVLPPATPVNYTPVPPMTPMVAPQPTTPDALLSSVPTAITDMPKLQLPTPQPKLQPQFTPPAMTPAPTQPVVTSTAGAIKLLESLGVKAKPSFLTVLRGIPSGPGADSHYGGRMSLGRYPGLTRSEDSGPIGEITYEQPEDYLHEVAHVLDENIPDSQWKKIIDESLAHYDRFDPATAKRFRTAINNANPELPRHEVFSRVVTDYLLNSDQWSDTKMGALLGDYFETPKSSDDLHLELNTKAFKLIANEIDRLIKAPKPTIEEMASPEWRRKNQGGPGNLPEPYQEAMDPYENWQYTVQQVVGKLRERYPDWSDEKLRTAATFVSTDPSLGMMLVFGPTGMFGPGAKVFGKAALQETVENIGEKVFKFAAGLPWAEEAGMFGNRPIRPPAEVPVEVSNILSNNKLITDLPVVSDVVIKFNEYIKHLKSMGKKEPLAVGHYNEVVLKPNSGGWIAPDGTAFVLREDALPGAMGGTRYMHSFLPSSMDLLRQGVKWSDNLLEDDMLRLGWMRFTWGGRNVQTWQITPNQVKILNDLWSKLPKDWRTQEWMVDVYGTGESFSRLPGQFTRGLNPEKPSGGWSVEKFQSEGRTIPPDVMSKIEQLQSESLTVAGKLSSPQDLLDKISRNERFTPEEVLLIRQPEFRDVKTAYQEWETKNPAFTPQRTTKPLVEKTFDEKTYSFVKNMLKRADTLKEAKARLKSMRVGKDITWGKEEVAAFDELSSWLDSFEDRENLWIVWKGME